MDDLARGAGYQVPGMEDGNAGEFEYIAAFSAKGPGSYEVNSPVIAKTVFIRAQAEKVGRVPGFWEKYHVNWREDLLPLEFDVAIVSGYGYRTHRELIRHCHRRGIPVAVWSDSNIRGQRGRGLKARLKRSLKKMWLARIARQVDVFLSANSRGAAYWRYYGVSRERVAICPPYTDYTRIEKGRTTDRASVLAKAGVSADKKVLYSSARLLELKRLDLVIGQFFAGRYDEAGWVYVIAGSGPEEQRLKAAASAQGEERARAVKFLGFQQPAENLALMIHAEMLVLSSRYEAHGIVVGEAMAAGTPVLVSNVVGAATDLVQPGVNGLVFKANDPVSLAEQLGALKDVEKLRAMRADARAAFEKWYRRTSPMVVVPKVVRMLLQKRTSKSIVQKPGR